MRFAHARTSALIAVALVCVFRVAPAHAEPDGPWLEVRTRHFALYGNAAAPEIEAISRNLERLRQAISRVAPALDLVPRRPLRVYVFRDWRSSKRYLPATGDYDRPGGVFLRHPDAALLIVHAGADLDASATTYHEYAHFVAEQNLPHVPLWLHEGLAELFSTFWASEFEAEVGQANVDYVERVRSERLYSLSELSAVDGGSAVYRDPRRKQLFHAQSWALAHFLLLGESADPDHLATNIGRLGRGETPEAVYPLLGRPAELTGAVRRHLERVEGRVLRLQLVEGTTSPSTREMPRDEALRRLGDLLAHQPSDRAGRAEKHYKQALKLNERNAGAYAGAALLHSHAGRRDEAIGRLRRAAELEPGDGWILFLLGRELLRDAKDAGTIDRGSVMRIRELLEESVRLEPDYVDPRAALRTVERILDQLPSTEN